ncbi:ESPR-type extended signal peptide-containing protein [Advenella alkanexedens]|uniref:ESPR-type extended signal peptide-containing protein n=1 Tax=Advenella alkanexedens TaxID=1481665 RepID=UPI002677374C|nr:ESPR-type extended signal peptide-containing protein [Advenella alkanexedens]WKU19113.1 ESPR-type extended signal peptide-containing protein [Advenella alkanexedens]
MNRIYKSIWNEQTGTYVAVSENVKAKGKRSGSSVLASAILAVTVGAYAQAQTVKVGDEEPVNGNRIVFSSDTGTIDGLSGTFDIADVNNANLAVTAGQLNTVNQAVIKNADDISALNGRVTTAEGEIDVLQTGLGTANTNISGLTTRVTTAEGKIDDLDTGLSTTNSNISGLTARVGETETDITTLQTTLSDLGVSDTFSGIKYFRVNSDKDDASATGVDSVAIGPQAVSSGLNSVALGFMTQAQAENAFAAGVGAVVTAEGGSAIALGDGAIAGGNAPGSGGTAAVAIGRNSVASGNSSVALGDHAKALAGNATALGGGAQATAGNSVAIGNAAAQAGNAFAAGNGAYAGSVGGIALGTGAGVGTVSTTSDDRIDHIAIGTNAGQRSAGGQNLAVGANAGSDIGGYWNVAIGAGAGSNLNGNSNVSIGEQANKAAGEIEHAVAIGGVTQAATDAVSIGYRSSSKDTGVALGSYSSADEGGVAVGRNTFAEGGSVALGIGAVARSTDASGAGYLTGKDFTDGTVVSVGNTNPATGQIATRRIVNVEDGAQANDAINVRQLKGAQQSVANLVGGDVTVESNGTFGGYVIELEDTNGIKHQYTTVAAAINAVSSGAISVLPGDAVIYNPNGTVTVATGVVGTDAVNVAQLQQAIADHGVKYFSVNSNNPLNRDGTLASGTNAIAIGPDSHALESSSFAAGHVARAAGMESVALGYSVEAHAANATVLGSKSQVYHAGGVAIGNDAESHGKNSLVMGTGARSHPKTAGAAPDNTIVIGTSAEATADNGIAIGQDAETIEERGIAQGFKAYAAADDAMAFGSNAVATGVSSQASGTGANASGLNAQASGTGASASGFNAVATGTGAVGYATDGIAMGTGAVSGFSDPNNTDTARNTAGIAIGKASLADEEHALALGVEAKARAKFATAIGDGAEATVAAVNGLAVGTGARVSAESAAAFGSGAGATALNATALGQGAQATHQGSVALGSGSFTAAAVNTPNLSIDKETYNFAGTNATSTVSVGGDGVVRTITNVAAGRVAANSTDAINGSQLHGTNMALEALADDLDTAGQSVADALGSGFGYDADKHQVTGSFTLNGNAGNNFTTIQQGLEHVAKGWNVGANGQTAANVAPGGSVDFSTSDGDIVIARNGTNLTFGLSDDIEIGNSITVGGPGNQTVINQGNVTTNNLTATGETRLGDKFVVKNDGTVTYNNTEIANKNDGLSFAGNTGGNIAKKLGDTTPLTISGALAGSEAVTGANLRVDSDGNKLNLVMARNLTDLDSIVINNGPVINNQGINMGGKRITGLAAGIDGTDAVNVDQLEAVETFANKGWDISANGSAGANVAPGGSVDFSNTDGNLVITRDGTDLTFNLANELTVGDTIIKGDSITTNNLTVDGRTQLGDNFIVNEDNSVTYKSAELANLNDGLSFMGDDSNIVTRKLNETLGLTGGADTGNLSENNLGVVQKDDGSLSIQLAKDLAGLNSATFKDDANTTVINSSGLTITDGPSVTVGGIDGGNKQITGVASGLGGINLADATGDTLTNAANIGDLQKATNNLTTAGLNFAGNTGDEIHKDLGEILNIVGGLDAAKDASDANIRVDSENGELRIKLATSLTDLENIQVGKDGVDGIDGTIGVNGKDGASVVLNGKDGSIGLTGPAGANGEPGASANISVKDGAPGLDGNDGVNGESKTRIVYEKPDGMTEEVATLNDGLKFVGDDGNTVSRKLNETLGLTGGAAAADLTGEGNIGVIQKDDGSLSIQLAKDIDLTEDGSLTVGDTVVSDTGLVVQDVTANPTATTKVEAGKIELFANPTGSPANTIAIDASTGDITGLTNRDLVADDFATAGRAATEEQLAIVNETANKGWNVSTNADTASSENVAPGETVDFDNTDGNIVIGQTGTNLTFDLAKNIKVDSINAGGTLINSNGLSFVDTNGAQLPNTVFIKPDGIDMGGRKITSLSKGEISATSTDAVNGSQLSFLADSVKNIFGGDVSFNFENGTFTSPTYTINGEDYSTVQAAIDKLAEGWKVTVSDPSGSNPGTGGTPGTGGGTSGTGTGGSSGTGTGGPADILPGDQLTLVGGDNIDIVQKPKDKGNVDIEISVDPNLVVDSVTTGKTVMDDSGVKVGENVKLGDTGLTIVGGPTGDLAFTADKVDVGGNKITSVANGTIAADSKDAVNGGQIHNIGESVANAFGGGSKVNPDGTVSAPSYTVGNKDTVVNNVGDALDVLNQGWTLNAGGNDSQVQAGDKVSLLNTDGNIVITQVLGSAEVNFNLNDKITVTEVNATTVNATTVNATTFQAGNTIVNNGGLSFVNKAGEQVGPSVSSSGINAGGSTITNVAAGVNDTDAVNVGQLKGVANNLNNQINAVRGDLKRVDRDARAGTASAAAMANLPQAYLPGKSVFAISTAGHRGEQGYAAGLSTITDNGKWILKGSVSGNSRGDVTYGAGVGYQW